MGSLDEYKQQIHELRRNLDLEKANHSYVAAELELLQANHEQQKTETQRKHAVEIDRLREQIEEGRTLNQSLEDAIRSLKLQIENLSVPVYSIPEPVTTHDVSDSLHLEQIHELTSTLHLVQEEVARLTEDNGSLRSKLGNAEEKIICLEETLQSKREEVEERDQALDQYQDTIQELRTELIQLQAEPDPEANKKGNSLFAEVDDQRQQVIHILGAQNKSFKEMKRAYRQSEAEIRQLKEENALMVREIDKCKSLFLTANRSHADHLLKRIADLQRDSNKWRQKVHFLEGQVTDGKVSAILEFYRNETDLVRQELNQCRLQKCELSELLHAAHQELAQWRFQCLKQKCVLIDREMRLEANNIAFESRCSIAVDETVSVALDGWHAGGGGAGGPTSEGSRAEVAEEEAAEVVERQRLPTMEPIILEIPRIPSEHNPDAPVVDVKVSIIPTDRVAVVGGVEMLPEERIKVEIKEEHSSPETTIPTVKIEQKEQEMKQELQEEEHKSHSTNGQMLVGEEVEEKDCEIVSDQQETVIDLCATVTEILGLTTATMTMEPAEERHRPSGAEGATTPIGNILKEEEWMDMSLEVAAEMNVSPMKMDFTTRKLVTGSAADQMVDERQQRSKESEKKEANGPINLDFLLDSPNKPQQNPIWLDMGSSSPEVESNQPKPYEAAEANKENVGRQRRPGGLAKLKYKPIDTRKSILVKSKCVLDNNQKSVHFATDVKEKLSGQMTNKQGDVEATKATTDRPKKKITVNYITIKSRPAVAAKSSPSLKD